MPKSPRPTELVIRETLRLAVLLGRDRYADIQRSLDQNLELLRQEQGVSTGNTPDTRTIKWIVKDYVNELPSEVVITEFPPHFWSLRNDYQELNKQKRQRDSMTIEAGGKHDLEVHHYEDVRAAIRDWLVVIEQPQPSFNPAAAGEPRHFGFGLAWNTEHDGIVTELVIENEGLLAILSKHLIPPIVDVDLWKSVERLKQNGTKFLTTGRQLGEQISAIGKAETDLDVVASWQREPMDGLTTQFRDTISRNAFGLENCIQYAYTEFAIAYLKRGIIVTQVTEGVRLLQGDGLDPTFKTAHVSTSGAWVMPGGPNLRLICDGTGEPPEITSQPVLFVLQLHGYPIAIGTLDKIRYCREVHHKLMQRYADSPEAMTVLLAQSNLRAIAKAISTQLKKASLYLQFPGKCPFCPGQ